MAIKLKDKEAEKSKLIKAKAPSK
jgi:hypothetical protein